MLPGRDTCTRAKVCALQVLLVTYEFEMVISQLNFMYFHFLCKCQFHSHRLNQPLSIYWPPLFFKHLLTNWIVPLTFSGRYQPIWRHLIYVNIHCSFFWFSSYSHNLVLINMHLLFSFFTNSTALPHTIAVSSPNIKQSAFHSHSCLTSHGHAPFVSSFSLNLLIISPTNIFNNRGEIRHHLCRQPFILHQSFPFLHTLYTGFIFCI